MSDIYYNKKIFCNLVKTNFDIKENNIFLKLRHSLYVAKLAKKLAKKLNLDPILAYNIGLRTHFRGSNPLGETTI